MLDTALTSAKRLLQPTIPILNHPCAIRRPMMNDEVNECESLRVRALELVNKVYRAFGKEQIQAFVPCITTEDTDCVLQALEEATGLSLFWGETDKETDWLGVWDKSQEIKERCDKMAQAWGTKQRIEEDESYNIELPKTLVEFACKVALEGEYPELEKEPPDHLELRGTVVRLDKHFDESKNYQLAYIRKEDNSEFSLGPGMWPGRRLAIGDSVRVLITVERTNEPTIEARIDLSKNCTRCGGSGFVCTSHPDSPSECLECKGSGKAV
jgi:hypothetical protein